VADYAVALGTTPDSLHNRTTRALGRTPLELIHQRVHLEARALLSRSTLSLGQVAAHLGFSSPAQFSAFFRRHEGLPPGRFRNSRSAQDAPRSMAQDPNFTDWP
jgi:AraC-like DNA-binding protein